MLKRETEKTYEYPVGDTVFIIESECPPDTREDMVDALVALMKRDIEELGGK